MNNIEIKVYEKLLRKICEKYRREKKLLMTESKRFSLMKSYLLRR